MPSFNKQKTAFSFPFFCLTNPALMIALAIRNSKTLSGVSKTGSMGRGVGVVCS
jgi:hypothetical protein